MRLEKNTQPDTNYILFYTSCLVFFAAVMVQYRTQVARFAVRCFQLIFPTAMTGYRSSEHLHFRGTHLMLGYIPTFLEKGLLEELLRMGRIAKQNSKADMASFCLGPSMAVLTTSQEHFRQSSRKELSRNHPFPLSDFIGLNTFSAVGDEWRVRHDIEAPYFSISGVKRLAPQMREIIQPAIVQLCLETDLNEAMHLLVMKLMLDSLYAIEPEQLDSVAHKAVPFLKKITNQIISFPNMAKRRTPALIRRYLYPEVTAPETIKRQVHDFIKTEVHPYMQKEQNTVMNALIGKLGLEAVIGDVFGLLFASVDSTASTITFLLYELAKHPEILVNLQTKIDEEFETYLDAIIKEILVLYPAFPLEVRGVVEPFKLDGFSLKTGDTCFMINPSLLEPCAFNPERWLQPTHQPGLFLPSVSSSFGHGARACNGQELAKQVIRLVVTDIISRFHFTTTTDAVYGTLNEGGSLKPNKSINMQFSLRQTEDAQQVHAQAMEQCNTVC